MSNKVRYGLRSVYYAIATDDGAGNLTYQSPQPWPGAVSLSLQPSGTVANFYADNTVYFAVDADMGYSGDLETALIPDAFRKDVLGETLDAKGFYVERSSDKRKEFALLFQFEGDEHATRHCLYKCSATRPNLEGQTVEDQIEPKTETITITAAPRANDEVVKARAPYTSSTTSSYQLWFTAVQEPTPVV